MIKNDNIPYKIFSTYSTYDHLVPFLYNFSACNLEDPITLEDLEFSYPSQCMDSEGICVLPCGYYQDQQPWCVTKIKNNRYDLLYFYTSNQ